MSAGVAMWASEKVQPMAGGYANMVRVVDACGRERGFALRSARSGKSCEKDV